MKYIGPTNEAFTNGESYVMNVHPMQGRIFEPGKNSDGSWKHVH
jgi:hypothetical protein